MDGAEMKSLNNRLLSEEEVVHPSSYKSVVVMPDHPVQNAQLSETEEKLDFINSLLALSFKEETGANYANSLNMLRTILVNIDNNPYDPKYRMIKTTNRIIREHISQYGSGVLLLKVISKQYVGFEVIVKEENNLMRRTIESICFLIGPLQEMPGIAPRHHRMNRSKVEFLANVHEERLQAENKKQSKQIRTGLARLFYDQPTKAKKPAKPAPVTAPAPAPAPVSVPTVKHRMVDLEEMANRIHFLINQARTDKGRATLFLDFNISKICSAYATGMRIRTHLSDATEYQESLREALLPHTIVESSKTEAVLSSHPDPAKAIVDTWMASTSDLHVLLGPYNGTGIGIHYDDSGSYYVYQIYAHVIS